MGRLQRNAKRYLILFNAITLCIGLSFLLAAVASRKPDVVESFLTKLVKRITGKPLPPELVKLLAVVIQYGSKAPVLLLFTGIVFIAASFVGCLGSCCKRIIMLKLYVIVGSILVLLLLGMCYFGARRIETLLKISVAALKFFMLNYHKESSRELVDLIQGFGKCCGALLPSDYNNNDNFDNYVKTQLRLRNETWNSTGLEPLEFYKLNLGDLPVPHSCCRKEYSGPYCGLSNNFTGRPIEDEILAYDDPKVLTNLMQELEQFLKNKSSTATKNLLLRFKRHAPIEIKTEIDWDRDILKSVVTSGRADVVYDLDYSYVDDMTTVHHIYGVGCSAKFIRYFHSQKLKLARYAIVASLPFILAYLSAVVYLKHLTNKRKAYAVEEEKSSVGSRRSSETTEIVVVHRKKKDKDRKYRKKDKSKDNSSSKKKKKR